MNESGYDPHISASAPIANLNDPNYCIRELKLDSVNKKLETPFKVLSGLNISKEEFELYSKNIRQPIFENERYLTGLKSWRNLHYLLTNASGNERKTGFRQFFRIKPDLLEQDSTLTTISLVFSRNPFEELIFPQKNSKPIKLDPLDWNSYIMLLNAVYTRSSALVLTPDIKLNKLAIQDYLQKIDDSVKILSDWNKKPIFVPLQIDLSKSNLESTFLHYKEHGYSNIWINFGAQPCDISYSENLRNIRQYIKKYLNNMDVVLYFSHIKKEINPNIQDTKVIASDILTQFNGADIIGVNRSPHRYFSSENIGENYWEEKAKENNFNTVEEYNLARTLNKTRLFDSNSYYYYNIDKYPTNLSIEEDVLLNNESINKFINSILLTDEISRVKKLAGDTTPKDVNKMVVNDIKNKKLNKDETIKSNSNKKIFNENKVRAYLKGKQAIIDNEEIKNFLMPSKRQANLIDMLAKL